ncbi:MAG: hypothetical protein HY744_13830 [Deltaproteobacteria bacterium]|nr:hypothetical protein [Deltaproteobacteria bacterium]
MTVATGERRLAVLARAAGALAGLLLGAFVAVAGCELVLGVAGDFRLREEGTDGGPGTPDPGTSACGFCPAGQRCDTKNGCVSCLVDENCSPDKPFCVLGGCHSCRKNDDCAAGKSCPPATGECAPKCTDAGDAGCASPPATICDKDFEACVGCVKDEDCTEPPVCHPVLQQCVECSTGEDCGAVKPVCQALAGTCVGCIFDDDCEGGLVCVGGKCTAPCTDDAACSPSKQMCNKATGKCVSCLDDSTCGDFAAAHCSPFGQCVACLTTDHCPGKLTCQAFECR